MDKSELALVQSLNYSGRTVIEGRSSTRCAWASLGWEGLNPEEPWGVLPSGRDVRDVLLSTDLTELQSAWIQVENSGVYGDLLWSTSMLTAFVSERFSSAIQDAGFAGYQLVPFEVQPKRGERFSGYSLLVPDNRDPDAPIRSFPYPSRATVSLDVSADVLAALTAAGVTEFHAEDAEKRAAELLAEE